jgi:hypothetical protein
MINTSAIKSLLLPGLDAVFGTYDMIQMQWDQIFERHTSDKAAEYDVEMKFLGLAQLRNEGAATAYEDMGERYKYAYKHIGVGLGFVITRTAMKDNLYTNRFGPQTRALRKSFEQTKEVNGISVLNNAFDATNYPIGDGVALCSASHPIDTGLVPNTPSVATELNETSLQDALIQIRRFRDAAGLRVMVKPEMVIVPVELEFTAERLFKTELRVGTADNDVSAFKSMGALKKGYMVSDFLVGPKYWFIKTNCDDGLKYFEREGFEIDMYTDNDTDNLKVRGYERYSFGVSNFRSIWGTNPT